MLVSEILSDVRKELIETAAAFYSDAELIRLMDRGQKDFVNKTRILEAYAYVSLVQGRLDYPFPANWLSDRATFIKIQNDSGSYVWKRLMPSNLEKTAQEAPNFLNTTTENQGRPSKYWIWGRTLWLNKAPSEEFTTQLAMFFKAKPTPLTTPGQSISIDDSLSEALTAFVLWKAWKKEKEADLASEQETIYLQYIAEGRKWVKKQSGDQRNSIDIDSPIPFDGSFNPFDPLAG